MKLKYLLAPLVFFASVMFATASYAVGTLTGVSAPASAAKNATVTITVAGSGSCGSSITYGDGTPDGSTGSSAFPHTYTHPYSSTGVKTITTGFGCSGSASTTIQIKSKFSTISSISGLARIPWTRHYGIKVMGSGRCNLLVKWGDGKSNVYNNYNLSAPVLLYHKYKLISKTFTIKVTPAYTEIRSFCRGTASKSVRVGLFGTTPTNPAIRKSPAIKKSPGVRKF